MNFNLLMKVSCICLLLVQNMVGNAQQPATQTNSSKTKSKTAKTDNSVSQMKAIAKEDKISADDAFKIGDYTLALALYLDELAKKPEDVNIRVKVGQCYLETDIKKSNAIDYFEYALANKYKNNDIALFLGRAYFYADRFDDAIAKFEQYKNLEFKKPENVAQADKYLKLCNNAKQYKQKAKNITFQNMGEYVNSTKSDNIGITNLSDNILIFNSNRYYSQDYGTYMWDILSTEYKANKWKKAHSLSTKVNTIDNDFLVGYSPDRENLFIRQEGYASSGDVFISPTVNKQYEVPSKLSASINGEKTIETSACTNNTGDTLFFASNRPGGFGGLDIYFSIKMGDFWSIPQNLGSNVNTPENEDYPNLSNDGKTLYFASEGHDGMGGFDIYSTTYDKQNNTWSEAQNIGYPLNSTYDDYTITFTSNPRYAYVSQVRDDGLGESDIYRVTFNDMEAPLTVMTGLIALGDTATARPLTSLTDKFTIKVIDKKNNTKVGQYSLSNESKYLIILPPGSYSLEVESEVLDKPFKKNFTIPDRMPENTVVTTDFYIKQ